MFVILDTKTALSLVRNIKKKQFFNAKAALLKLEFVVLFVFFFFTYLHICLQFKFEKKKKSKEEMFFFVDMKKKKTEIINTQFTLPI